MRAKEVKIICLGKTIRRVEDVHNLIIEKLEKELQEINDEYCSEVEEIENNFDSYMDYVKDDYDDEELSEIFEEAEFLKKQAINNISDSTLYTEDNLKECSDEAHRALSGEDYLTPDNPFISVFKSL